MKISILFCFIIILSSLSSAQTIGYNSILFHSDYNRGIGSSYRYAGGIEYDYRLSDHFDFISQSAFIHSSYDSEVGKLEFMHIPIYGGIRYSPFDFLIRPFISASGAVSYFKNDRQMGSSYIYNKEHVLEVNYGHKESFSRLVLGTNIAFGAITKITDNWGINLNIFVTHFFDDQSSYSEYYGYTLGIDYTL